MAMKQFLLKRPLLVGGLGISASLWLLEASPLNPWDGSTLFSALALGSGLWWWRRGRSRLPAAPRPVAAPVVDRARLEVQLEDLRRLLEALATEAALIPDTTSATLAADLQDSVANYEAQRQALATARDRTHIHGRVTGERHSGKSTILRHLQASSITWTEDAAPLLPPENGTAPDNPAGMARAAADLVLWVTEGDLTASALAQIRQHGLAGQGVIIAFNKTDHYAPADQQTVLAQLQSRGEGLPGNVSVVAVAANPRPVTVRRHQANGEITEGQEAVPPHLADLDAALADWLHQSATLVAATTLRRGETLRQRIQQDLNHVRRQRAMPLIDQLQWLAGAAALANPLPSLDVLATLGINGQLVMDLGQIYGFNLSLEEAKTAATTLAELTVKLGLVELSTQVLTAVLKSHVATYVAGGLVQGLSAAYLTRMAGLSLIDYFEQAALAGTPSPALSWEALAQRLAEGIQQNRSISLVQNLVKQGMDMLKPAPEPALLNATGQVPVALTLSAEAIPVSSPGSPPPS
jgi:uncharacterized protein (DUF697 family)